MRGGDKTLMKAFGLELSSLRKAARISQEELAHRAKVNRTYVAKLELGENQPTLTSMFNLAGALGKPLPEMVTSTLERYETLTKIEQA
jgi:transcriptional regulator with XRE-family HTH domain